MLKGKVAIVTGSTSGIGLGIAKELAGLGADLVLNGFGDAGEIEAIRSGIEREHGVRVVYDGADMSKEQAVRGLIARMRAVGVGSTDEGRLERGNEIARSRICKPRNPR